MSNEAITTPPPKTTYGPGSGDNWRILVEEAARYEDALERGARCSWIDWLDVMANDHLQRADLYYELSLPYGESSGEHMLEFVKRFHIFPPCSPAESEDHMAWSDRWDELARMPYGDYLQTPEWQATRRAVRRRFRDRCAVCNGLDSLHVHHRTYARRGMEDVEDLVLLCADCHSAFHERRGNGSRGLAK